MSFTSLLNSEMSVRTRTIAVDTCGGQSVRYSTIHTTVPCRVNVLSNEQQAILSRSGIIASHRVFCGADVTCVAENELIIGSTTYRVVDALSYDNSLSAHHKTLLARTPS